MHHRAVALASPHLKSGQQAIDWLKQIEDQLEPIRMEWQASMAARLLDGSFTALVKS